MTGILPIKKYGTHSALNMFDEFSMIDPGPLASYVGFTESEVVDLAYDVAFTQFNYGLSSVFSLVSTVITCVILIAICGAIQKRTFYYN